MQFNSFSYRNKTISNLFLLFICVLTARKNRFLFALKLFVFPKDMKTLNTHLRLKKQVNDVWKRIFSCKLLAKHVAA